MTNINDLFIKACKSNQLEQAKVLLEQGADIHANDDLALRWASSEGRLEVVKFLVENGADVHADDDYALRYASEEVREYFEKMGFYKE